MKSVNRIAATARRAGARALLLAAALPAVAAHASFAAPPSPALPGPTGGLLRVLLALALVLAAVAGVAWLLRRMRGLGGGGERAIELVAQASLGTRERVVLVRVGGHELLLGVAAGSVRTLLVLGDSVAVAQDAAAPGNRGSAPQADPPAPAAAPSFAAALRSALARSLGK
ncbi:MAG: flagellar biosynthetic protein FliO [Gammaproteobacteria bacterium]|nr:flagellar biosynthetic protein FliO [Gammaproteobacteria bacterium]